MVKGRIWTIGLIICSSIVLSACGNTQETKDQGQTPVLSDKSGENVIDKTKEITEGKEENVEINTEKNLQNIDASKSPFEKGYYDYRGTINNKVLIEMSIYPLEDKIVGSYYYVEDEKGVKLEGKAGEKEIILKGYDENEKNTGIFKGTMDTVDEIQGTWISGDGTKQYPFSLSLKSILPGAEYGKRYGIALNTKNDKDLENFVVEIQGYIANGNKEKLSEQMIYPINVNVDGTRTKIKNKDEFIKNYDRIFHSEYKREMIRATTRYLFANAEGIMFGEGSYNLWINEITSNDGKARLAIVAINN